MTADWTIPLDDCLIERFGGCSACGRRPAVHLGLHVLDDLAIATSLCGRCHTQDPQQLRVGARLRQRYDPTRWDGTRPA
jgi:hypothetical protein